MSAHKVFTLCVWVTHVLIAEALNVSTLGKAGIPGYTNGVATLATFNSPLGAAVDLAGSFGLIVSGREVGLGIILCVVPLSSASHVRCILCIFTQVDSGNNAIRRIEIFSGLTSSFVGLEILGFGTSFGVPSDIAMDAAGSFALLVSTLREWCRLYILHTSICVDGKR